MTYEAGFCVFAFIVFCCVLVYALYRRALAVDESVYDDWASAVNETCENINELLSRDDVLELASRIDTDTLESGNSKIPPSPFSPVPERVQSVSNTLRAMSEGLSTPSEYVKPRPKGWQGWEGGDCPVPHCTDVVIMRRNGEIHDTSAASCFEYGYGAGDLSGWHHAEIFSGQYDIVAWRVAD